MDNNMGNNPSPWIERVGLPLVMAFAVGVLITDTIRETERERADQRQQASASGCSTQARSQ